MSNTLQQLRRQARDLRTMLGEIPRLWNEDRFNWRQETSAPRTVGTNISLGALAEHFLLTWIEWFQVSRLYSWYFGHGVWSAVPAPFLARTRLPTFSGLPRSWDGLHRRCQAIKDVVEDDEQLAEVWSEAWHLDGARTAALSSDDVEQLFLALVESHSRRRLLQVLDGFGDGPWTTLYRRLIDYDIQLGEAFAASGEDVRDRVLLHLRAYRHSTLEVSWLSRYWQFGADDAVSTVRRLTMEAMPDGDGPEAWVARIRLDDAVRQHARALLSRLQRAVWEVGFASLASDVASADFVPGPWTPVVTQTVVINPTLPLEREDDDRRIMAQDSSFFVVAPPELGIPESLELPPLERGRIALCMGSAGGGWIRFSKLLDQVLASLRASGRVPDLVICITDAWDSAAFARWHRRDVRAMSRAGAEFMFFVAGVPDRRISMLEIPV